MYSILGGFAVVLVIAVIGVLVAYRNRKKKSDERKRKWAIVKGEVEASDEEPASPAASKPRLKMYMPWQRQRWPLPSPNLLAQIEGLDTTIDQALITNAAFLATSQSLRDAEDLLVHVRLDTALLQTQTITPALLTSWWSQAMKVLQREREAGRQSRAAGTSLWQVVKDLDASYGLLWDVLTWTSNCNLSGLSREDAIKLELARQVAREVKDNRGQFCAKSQYTVYDKTAEEDVDKDVDADYRSLLNEIQPLVAQIAQVEAEVAVARAAAQEVKALHDGTCFHEPAKPSQQDVDCLMQEVTSFSRKVLRQEAMVHQHLVTVAAALAECDDLLKALPLTLLRSSKLSEEAWNHFGAARLASENCAKRMAQLRQEAAALNAGSLGSPGHAEASAQEEAKIATLNAAMRKLIFAIAQEKAAAAKEDLLTKQKKAAAVDVGSPPSFDVPTVDAYLHAYRQWQNRIKRNIAESLKWHKQLGEADYNKHQRSNQVRDAIEGLDRVILGLCCGGNASAELYVARMAAQFVLNRYHTAERIKQATADEVTAREELAKECAVRVFTARAPELEAACRRDEIKRYNGNRSSTRADYTYVDNRTGKTIGIIPKEIVDALTEAEALAEAEAEAKAKAA